jgi:hypothetical protein
MVAIGLKKNDSYFCTLVWKSQDSGWEFLYIASLRVTLAQINETNIFFFFTFLDFSWLFYNKSTKVAPTYFQS